MGIFKTYLQIAFQEDNATAYKKHRFFILPDPAMNIVNTTPFLLEGKVKRISVGLNDRIGTADIEFPSKTFGNHIGHVSPIAIALDNANNIIIRGFLCIEDAVLDRSNDILSAQMMDYKWLIGKLSKIRGKIYTVDNYVAPDLPSFFNNDSRVFYDPSLFEKFRYMVPDPDPDGQQDYGQDFDPKDAFGYVSSVSCIFNEQGNPDAASEDFNSNHALAFKYKADPYYVNNLRVHQRFGDTYFYWNYATMIAYVARYYIEPLFEGILGTTKIRMNYTSLVKILRYGELLGKDIIIPKHFDINNLSPTQALTKIVESIPGTWFWRLVYFQDTVFIDILNHTNDTLAEPGKALYIGDGGKVNNETNNNVNVASITARKSCVDSISHALAVGGALELESTFQYAPAWTQYLRPIADFTTHPDKDATDYELYDRSQDDGFIPEGMYVSNFKNPTDYQRYLQFAHNLYESDESDSRKLLQSLGAEEFKRYALMFRLFKFPEYKYDIAKFSSIPLSAYMDDYEGYATFLHELIFTHMIRVRKIKGPVTNYREEIDILEDFADDKIYGRSKRKQRKLIESQPFLFLYDSTINQTEFDGTGGVSAEIASAILQSKNFILPDDPNLEDKGEYGYSLELDNRLILFEQPQIERKTISFRNSNSASIPEFMAWPTPRKVFLTCRIELDTCIIKDTIKNRHLYSGANLVSQDVESEYKVIIRNNAFYPTPEGKIGDALIYEEGNISQIGTLRRSGNGTDSVVGSKIIDWNRVDSGGAEAVVVVDDREQLKQMIEIMLGETPAFQEEINVDFGRVDTSYLVGDRITRIIGSELEDGSGGYYGLRSIIDSLEYSREGETDAFSSSANLINYLPVRKKPIEDRRR